MIVTLSLEDLLLEVVMDCRVCKDYQYTFDTEVVEAYCWVIPVSPSKGFGKRC